MVVTGEDSARIDKYQEEDDLLIITSKYSFFDMFGMIKEKIAIPIAETLILQTGNLKQWIFNSNSQNPPVILKKKPSKLYITEGLVKMLLPKKPPQNILNIYQ